jgi:hypothetical protein
LSALNQDEQRKLFVFFLSCADKGTRTDCGGSTDLSAVIDCASCCATTNIGRVSVAQASLALTLTPSSIPTVFRPIKPPWSALALLNAVRVPRSATLIVAIIFTFPLNPPLTKGNLWQVFHLLIFDDTPITFQHLPAQWIFETTVLV